MTRIAEATAQRGFSDQLDDWLRSDADKSVGGLVDLFGEKSFAILFVLLLAPSALPLPTGGVTNAFEVVAMLTALQLVVGRRRIWLPDRWRRIDIGGPGRRRQIGRLTEMVRRLERFTRPRLAFVFGHRLSNIAFGLLVIGGTLGAFLAPPFSGLDTLPSLGVVVLSLGVLLEDVAVVIAGIVLGIAGVLLEVLLADVAVDLIRDLF